MEEACVVVVNNMDDDAGIYVVARPFHGELWFWGSWDEKEKAQDVAKSIGGIVVERVMKQ